jgi:hypothetical protein
VSDEPPIESAAERAFKRRFGGKEKGRQKRDDYALDLFREALAYLDDTARVNSILRELGKLYNAVTNAPIVSLDVRRRVIGLLEAGQADAARQALDECRRLYAPTDGGDGGATWKVSQD